MSFKTPSTDQVRALGDSLGMEITEDYAKSFISFIRPFGDGYRLLASLPDDVPAIKHLRGAYYRPRVTRTNTAPGSPRPTSKARAVASLPARK
jgi:hypothetical protein